MGFQVKRTSLFYPLFSISFFLFLCFDCWPFAFSLLSSLILFLPKHQQITANTPQTSFHSQRRRRRLRQDYDDHLVHSTNRLLHTFLGHLLFRRSWICQVAWRAQQLKNMIAILVKEFATRVRKITFSWPPACHMCVPPKPANTSNFAN